MEPNEQAPPVTPRLTQIRAYATLATRMCRELRRAEQSAWELGYLHQALGLGLASDPASPLATAKDANGYVPNTDVPADDLDAMLAFMQAVTPILEAHRGPLRRVAGAEGF